MRRSPPSLQRVYCIRTKQSQSLNQSAFLLLSSDGICAFISADFCVLSPPIRFISWSPRSWRIGLRLQLCVRSERLTFISYQTNSNAKRFKCTLGVWEGILHVHTIQLRARPDSGLGRSLMDPAFYHENFWYVGQATTVCQSISPIGKEILDEPTRSQIAHPASSSTWLCRHIGYWNSLLLCMIAPLQAGANVTR